MVNFLKIKQLKTDCLRTFKDISSFMDSDLKDLRYMRKSFGYLVYNSIKYIVKHNGKMQLLLIRRINLYLVNHSKKVIMELMKMVKC